MSWYETKRIIYRGFPSIGSWTISVIDNKFLELEFEFSPSHGYWTKVNFLENDKNPIDISDKFHCNLLNILENRTGFKDLKFKLICDEDGIYCVAIAYHTIISGNVEKVCKSIIEKMELEMIALSNELFRRQTDV